MYRLRLLEDIFWENDREKLMVYCPNVEKALETLTERESCALRKRYSGMDLESVGKAIINLRYKLTPREGVSKERARQIIAKSLRKLRHPLRMAILKGR